MAGQGDSFQQYLNHLRSLNVAPAPLVQSGALPSTSSPTEVAPPPTSQPSQPVSAGLVHAIRDPHYDEAGKPIRAAYGANITQYTKDYDKWRGKNRSEDQKQRRKDSAKRKREENPEWREYDILRKREAREAAKAKKLEDMNRAAAAHGAKQVNTRRRLTVGSRAQVWHGSAMRTSGGLIKAMLMKNKAGRIVSRKASQRARSKGKKSQ